VGISRRFDRLGALGLLMVAGASCTEPPVEHGDRGVRYDTIGELVASADAVAIGRVAATSRGRVLDQIEQPGWETTARRPGWRGWFDTAGERPWRLKGRVAAQGGQPRGLLPCPGPTAHGLGAAWP
jgi:hypothetical protein